LREYYEISEINVWNNFVNLVKDQISIPNRKVSFNDVIEL